MRTLAESIIDTLAFFAIFDWPLTSTEVYQWLWQPPANTTPSAVLLTLADLANRQVIETGGGYFCLSGIEAALERRRGAHWLVEHKMQRARRALWWTTWVPFLRAVFICNTVAFGWPRAQSDIDVFVVVKRGRLWLTRALFTGAIALSGYRRHGQKVADRVCLSFYITDDVLDLEPVKKSVEDVLLTYWVLFLHPLYDPEQLAHTIRLANQWAVNTVPMAPSDTTVHPYAPHYYFEKIKKMLAQMLGGSVGDYANYWAGVWQKQKMQRNHESVQNYPDSRVVVSDTMLKFHENDRRDLYREQWNTHRAAAKARL